MSFTDFWSQNPQVWFAGNRHDHKINEKFKHLLLKYEQIKVNENTYNIKSYLERILICDQLTRHYDRQYQTFFRNTLSPQAVEMTLFILDNKKDDFLSLAPEHQCFIMLPLRHTRKVDYVGRTINEVHKLIKSKNPVPNIYYRFYKASLQCMADIMEPYHYSTKDDVYFPMTKGLLDPDCLFQLDSLIGFNKVTGKVEEIPDSWVKAFESTVPKEKVLISISGGGDSMTCSYLLKKLGYDVTAVMVNYSNRETCIDEVKMVHWWCKQLGIELYVMHIDCITRDRSASMRDIYEPVTRQMRFNLYKKVAELIEADEPRVVLGHNRDDTFENIIANLTKNRSMYNLKQIKPSHQENGVWIYRPIRDIQKSDITQFLQNINGPFLYDSTPDWSFRGRTRDVLVPALNSFDAKLVEGIERLADALHDMSQNYFAMLENQTTFEVKKEMIRLSKNNKPIEKDVIEIQLAEKARCDVDYWSYIFTKLNKDYNYPNIGGGRIEKLVEKLKKNDSVQHNLQNDVVVRIDGNNAIVYKR